MITVDQPSLPIENNNLRLNFPTLSGKVEFTNLASKL